MPIPPRSRVLDVPIAVHGTPDPEELHRFGVNPAELLDFSSNINAYGPSPKVRQAVARTPLDRYPDDEASALRAALAEHLGVSPRCILPGNGSAELIWLASLAFLNPNDWVMVLGPTFAEYARTALLLGARVINHLARRKNRFSLPSLDALKALDFWRPRLVFLCNPNNPTGIALEPHTIAEWSYKYPLTLFVVDESYQSFSPDLGTLADAKRDNVLVLRSMTKDYALAGLRLGYAVGAEEMIATLVQVRPPWSINAMAQAAGIAALRDQSHLARSLELLAAAKGELMAALADVGMKVLPSAAPFFLARRRPIRVSNGAAVRSALLSKGILVRDCASFDLPEYIRICTRRPKENARLVAALREVIHGG
jgi:histidinol-phosphate aminotransferase